MGGKLITRLFTQAPAWYKSFEQAVELAAVACMASARAGLSAEPCRGALTISTLFLPLPDFGRAAGEREVETAF